MRNRIVLLGLLLLSLAVVGCKPYNTPEFQELSNNETGFLIPLEGDTTDQTLFDSEDYLGTKQVAAKKVQIPKRWVKTGRLWFDGKWVPTVRLLTVNRTPITREWTADNVSGTSKADEAIWVESRDSVGFSIGFNCTAKIDKNDATKFLYQYQNRSLATVMDTEIRARVQSVAAEVAAKDNLDVLRTKKQEIIDAVRADVIPFFAQKGITITTVGMFGGFTYENVAIQEAIDNTFVAQQEKVVAAAQFDAQQKKNERIELEAEALAEKARTIANGEADALRSIAEATKAAGKDPTFLEIKRLEVESARIQAWNGQYPSTLMNLGTGGAPNLLLNLPTSR